MFVTGTNSIICAIYVEVSVECDNLFDTVTDLSR